MILRTAQNCSHGSAFAVDGGTTNCVLTRWLMIYFGVPFDLVYVDAPGSRSSAAARTKADRWQLQEQRRRQGRRVATHIIINQGCQRHTHLYGTHRHFAPGFTTVKNCDNDTSPRHICHPALQPLCFLRLACDHAKKVCDGKVGKLTADVLTCFIITAFLLYRAPHTKPPPLSLMDGLQRSHAHGTQQQEQDKQGCSWSREQLS